MGFETHPSGEAQHGGKNHPNASNSPGSTAVINGGFLKWEYAQIIDFYGIFSTNQPFLGTPMTLEPLK